MTLEARPEVALQSEINRLNWQTPSNCTIETNKVFCRLANPPPDRGHEKAPVPDSLAAQGTRAEITGLEVARQAVDYTVQPRLTTRPRILGTLHLRVAK